MPIECGRVGRGLYALHLFGVYGNGLGEVLAVVRGLCLCWFVIKGDRGKMWGFV